MVDIVVPFNKLGEAIEKDIEDKVRKIILSVFANLDSASPIGRPSLWASAPPEGYRPGWFKANWKVFLGSIGSSEPVPENFRGVIVPDLGKYKLGKIAVIINNAPYAERLGDGHSQQAPIGWIDGAIRNGVRRVT